MVDTFNVKVGIDATGAKKGARVYERSADDISRASKQMEQRVNRASQSLNKVGKSGQLLKGVITGIGIGGLAAAFAASTREALAFSGAMDEVFTLTGASFGPTESLTDEVKRLSSEFGNAPVDTAKALYQVISAGAEDAAEAVETLTAANKLAIGGVTDVATAADGLTSILNAYGDEAGTATNVTDAMFVAMKAGKTTIGELSASIGNVAPITAQLGVSFQEVLGATAALTKSGISTSQAMNGIKAAMANIIKPTKQASDIAQKLGIDFSAAGLKAAGSMEAFLDQIKAAGGGSVEVLGQLFGSIEGLNAILALTGSAAKDFNQIMKDMKEKGGATDEAYRIIAEGSAQQFKVATNNMRLVLLELGEAIVEFVLPAIRAFNEHINEIMTAVQVFTALLAARLAASLVNAALSFAGVGAAATGASVGVNILNNSLKLIGGPIGLLVIGVTALVAAYALLKTDLEEMAELPVPVSDALEKLRQETEKEPTSVAVGDAIKLAMVEAQLAIIEVDVAITALQEKLLRQQQLQEEFRNQTLAGKGDAGTGFALALTTTGIRDTTAQLEALHAQQGETAVAFEALTFRTKLFKNELGGTEEILVAFNALSTEAQAVVRATGLSFGEAATQTKAATEEVEEYVSASGDVVTITKTENRLLGQLTKKYLATANAEQQLAKATTLVTKLSGLSAESLEKMGLTAGDLTSLMEQLRIEIDESKNVMTAAEEKIFEAALAYIALQEELFPAQRLQREFNEGIRILNEIFPVGTRNTKEYADAVAALKARMAEGTAEVNKNTAAIDPWQEAWKVSIERIDGLFKDLWASAFSGFGDFVDAVKNTFRQMLAEMAHAAITRPILISMGLMAPGAATAGTSVPPGTATAASSFLPASMTGYAGAGVGGFGGTIGGTASGATGFLTGGIGITGAGLAGGLAGFALGSSLGGGGTGANVGSAIGAIGLGIAGGVFGGIIGGPLGAKLGQALGTFVGGIVGGLIGGLFDSDKTLIELAGPDVEFNRKHGESRFVETELGGVNVRTRDIDAETMAAIDETIATFDNAIASILDEDQLSAVIDSLEDWQLKIKDKSVTIDQLLNSRFDVILSNFTDTVQDFVNRGDDLEGKINRLQLGLTAERLVESIGDSLEFLTLEVFLNAAEQLGGSAEEMGIIMEQIIVGFTAMQNALDADPIAAAAEYLAGANVTLTDSYTVQRNAVMDYLREFDGSFESLAVAGQAVGELKLAMLNLLVAFEQVRAEVNKIFSDTRSNLLESTLSSQEIFQRRKDQAAALLEELRTETDPGRILELSTEINRLVNEAFNIAKGDQSIDPGDIDALALEFISFLDIVEELVNMRLDEGITGVTDDLNRLNEEAAEVMGEAAATMVAAAETMGTAANNMSGAVDRFGSIIDDADFRFSPGFREINP